MATTELDRLRAIRAAATRRNGGETTLGDRSPWGGGGRWRVGPRGSMGRSGACGGWCRWGRRPRSAKGTPCSAILRRGLMGVYVDGAIWEKGGRLWCHLTADTADELHAFAAMLGLRRWRFQSKPGRPWVDHYDIPEPKRREAVALGAVEVTISEAGAQIARKREAALRSRLADGESSDYRQWPAAAWSAPTARARHSGE